MTDDELTTETPAMHHLSAQFSSILLTDRPPGRACPAAGLVVSQAKIVGSFARPPACLPAVADFTQSRHTPSNGGRRGEMRAKKKNRRSLSPRSDWAEPKVTERKNEKKIPRCRLSWSSSMMMTMAYGWPHHMLAWPIFGHLALASFSPMTITWVTTQSAKSDSSPLGEIYWRRVAVRRSAGAALHLFYVYVT